MYDDVYIGSLISEEYLAHHGIKGQKWGTKHGPPYPLDDKVSARISKMKSFGRKKVDAHDTATMAKYRTTDRGHRILRAARNGVIGQKLMVRFNKGYREDRAAIKAEYKAGKKELNKKASNYKEQKQALKNAYKESKLSAAVRAADAIYGKQSHELNQKIQSESIGKSYIKSLFMTDYGSLVYNSSRINDAANRGTSTALALMSAPKYKSTKYKDTSPNGHGSLNNTHDAYLERQRIREAKQHGRYNYRTGEYTTTETVYDPSFANSFVYSQTGVSKADREKVAAYRKSQKEQARKKKEREKKQKKQR